MGINKNDLERNKVKKIDQRQDLVGVSITSGDKVVLLKWLESIFSSQAKGDLVTITTPNPEQVVLASKNDVFRRILNESTIAIPDGGGLLLASRILGLRRLSRIPGREFGLDLVKVAAENGERVMFLGGRLTNDQVSMLKSQVGFMIQDSRFKIKYLHGVRDIKNESDKERKKILEEIRKFKPGLLLVGYGAPWQEYWMWNNRDLLEKAEVKVVMVVGGAFDVWSGKVKSVPDLVARLGFEWLWRLLIQPWRWKRQLALIEFGWMVLKARILN